MNFLSHKQPTFSLSAPDNQLALGHYNVVAFVASTIDSIIKSCRQNTAADHDNKAAESFHSIGCLVLDLVHF